MAGTDKTLPVQTIEVNVDTWQSRREPFLKLCRELGEQRDRFTNGAHNKTDLSAATRSVAAVIQFLIEAVPSAPQLADVLHQLGTALADLDQGESPPLLRPRPNAYRPRRPTANQERYAVASAYVTLKIKGKSPLLEAVEDVNLLFRKYAVPLPGNTANALKDWRKRLLNRHDSDEIKGVYLKALDNAQRQAADTGVSPADLLWSVLQDFVGKPTESKIEF